MVMAGHALRPGLGAHDALFRAWTGGVGRATREARVSKIQRPAMTPKSATSDLLYFEDLHAGQTFDCGTHVLTAEEIIAFASEFDPQPMHTDPEAAQHGMLGGLVASGWHLCALSARMLVDALFNRAHSIGSPGVDEVQWRRPARVGDTVRVTCRVLEIRPSEKRTDRGYGRLLVEMTRDTHRVMFWTGTVMFATKGRSDVA
jgi:acyl dehydratase